MKGYLILQAALAHAYEQSDKDALDRNLSVQLLNLGIAELTDAENAFRANYLGNSAKPQLTEPVTVTSPDDDVPYDYHITSILLPLWLCWKVFEGMDDPSRGMTYREMYETELAKRVPAVWVKVDEPLWEGRFE